MLSHHIIFISTLVIHFWVFYHLRNINSFNIFITIFGNHYKDYKVTCDAEAWIYKCESVEIKVHILAFWQNNIWYETIHNSCGKFCGTINISNISSQQHTFILRLLKHNIITSFIKLFATAWNSSLEPNIEEFRTWKVNNKNGLIQV